MKLDIQTLAFISCLTFVTQVIALFVQYRVNRTYRGIGWWLLGSSLMALGFIFMPMLTVKSLEMLARIANPLMVLGQIFLYIGIIQFLDMKENRRVLSSIFAVFTLSYYYYMYIHNDISGRTVVVSATLAAMSLMTAYKLFFKRDRLISGSANFTTTVFLAYGCFLTVRTFLTLILPPIHSYVELVQIPIHIVTYIVPIITSTLWTFGFILMVNQRLNSENRVEKEKLQQIFNTSPDAALITRLNDGLFVDVNVGFLALTGYTHDEVIGDATLKISVWYNIEDQQIFIAELKDKGICENMEFVFQRKDGSQFVGMISARIITIHAAPHIVSVIRDITERKQAEEALMESEEKYRSILNASPDDITITDLEGRILMVSPASKKMFGYEADYDRFIGMRLIDFIVPEDVERAQSNIMLMYQGGYPRPNEYRGVRKDQSIFDIEVNSGFVHSANGQPTKMVFIVRDITERKLAEQQIQELVQQLEIEKNTAQFNSITDSLTGLANRRYFDEALRTEFYRLKRSGSTLSLIMLDVDHFKKFNDWYGHLAGDDCLRHIGTTLKTIVGRVPDIVARYGGEEFVVVLPETDDNGAEALAERIRKTVEELAIPHSTSDTAEYVTVSLGVVTVYTTKISTPEQVVALADEALYCAKKGGRNRIAVATGYRKTW
ncbi:diguanylate cyclase [Desulfosporosinus sp. Sb-LF]|uniref:diguanylate cyclase domain-containing protein n=1 Tax=Desulfosporosinus sp. Sb-LF TaxID=2560027 RepID=UPI00107F2C34|nr:diguanylate cyclase [Desulfosporosinus sp. Sb-LF]TGE32196.1 diguanylate cyclase [Desulfosporosinus sp. Sb-LF]